MRRAVVNESLQEMEVHPPETYLALVDACVASAKQVLNQSDPLRYIDCPACGAADSEPAFEKVGYTYRVCRDCATLFISPRPSASMLDWYLKDSPAAQFRSSPSYLEAMETRATELAAYRANWIAELKSRTGPNGQRAVVDVETRSPAFLSVLLNRKTGPVAAAKPLYAPSKADELIDGLASYGELSELDGADAGVVMLFDVLEHQVDPGGLLQEAWNALGRNGLLVITTRSASGFDVQILWEDCVTVFPLEHVNLLSVEGIRAMLTDIGFDVLEISTPGQLDIQMIERTLEDHPEADVPRFVRYFLTHRDRYAKERFQAFLQANRLSSHLRAIARKPNGR